MSLSIATVQSTLENWVQSILNLPESNLLWADQEAPEPAAGAWASMKLSELVPVGPFDTARTNWAPPGAALGEEVQLTTEGYRSLTFALQAFSRGIVVGDDTAMGLLQRVLNACQLGDSRVAFRGAGLALYRRGSVQNLSALNAQRREGRALLELFFYAVDGADERTGYIETVRGTLVVQPTNNQLPFDARLGSQPPLSD